MTKLVLINPQLYDSPNNGSLINSFTSDVIPIKYNDKMTKDELLTAIGQEQITHLAFIYHYPGYDSLPFFIDNRYHSAIGPDSKLEPPTLPKYNYYSDRVIDIIQTLQNSQSDTAELIVDILTCNLTGQKYKEEVDKIQQDLGINIRYSVDKTGNPENGGNWVLESELPEKVNVQTTYFTDGILEWKGVLTADISSSIKSNPTNGYINWDNGTNTYTVQQDFLWSDFLTFIGSGDADSYIGLLANETFDGNGKVIDITGYNSWSGLFSTGGTSISDASFVKDLGIVNGIIFTEAGFFILQRQIFFTISNCYSTGNISTYGGGIAGNFSGEGGICTISNCYSTGNIDLYGGGITGDRAGNINGNCTITNCYSTGNIGSYGGGITGSDAGNNNGICTISNCYSTGNIGTYGGGIAGNGAGSISDNCTISNCYSTGSIDSDGGGIVGSFAGILGNCIVENCYSTGNISSDGGGIAGSRAGEDGNCIISNCYTTGSIGFEAGGITGSLAGDVSGTCTINNSVCNGTPTAGTGSIITSTNNSTTLSDIDNSLYSFWPSPSTVWKVGNAVPTVSNFKLPILLAFQALPWIFTVSDPLYYQMATTAAQFYIEPPPPPEPIPSFQPLSIPPCCEPNVCNSNPQSSNYNSDVIVNKKAGKEVDRSVDNFYSGVASGQRTAHSQPIFKSYYDYINYLQGKYK